MVTEPPKSVAQHTPCKPARAQLLSAPMVQTVQQQQLPFETVAWTLKLGKRENVAAHGCKFGTVQVRTGVGDPTDMPELAEEDGALVLHRLHDGLPRLNLLLGEDAGRVRIPAASCRDVRATGLDTDCCVKLHGPSKVTREARCPRHDGTKARMTGCMARATSRTIVSTSLIVGLSTGLGGVSYAHP